MQNLYSAIAVGVVAVVVLVLGALFLRLVRVYVQARIAGASVSLTDLVATKMMGADPVVIATSLTLAAREGIAVTVNDLRTVALAGGDVGRVVSALIIARRGNVDLPWDKAMAIDLAGWDVLAAARGASDAEIKATWKEPGRPGRARS